MLVHAAIVIASFTVTLVAVSVWKGWPMEHFREIRRAFESAPRIEKANVGDVAKCEGRLEPDVEFLESPIGGVKALAVVLRMTRAASDDPEASWDEVWFREWTVPFRLARPTETDVTLTWTPATSYGDGRYEAPKSSGPVRALSPKLATFLRVHAPDLADVDLSRPVQFDERVVPYGKPHACVLGVVESTGGTGDVRPEGAYRTTAMEARSPSLRVRELHTTREDILVSLGTLDVAEAISDLFLFGIFSEDVAHWIGAALATTVVVEAVVAVLRGG
ncbi:MAG: hypothetical protein U0169_06735 [Polyangiaceae bacterium]